MNNGLGLNRGVWHVSRECGGIAEAGGLKDVVAGLSEALVREEVPAAVILPRYGFIDPDSLGAKKLDLRFYLELPIAEKASRFAAEPVDVFKAERSGAAVYLLDSPRTRSKRGIYTYTAEDEKEDPRRRKGSGHWDAHHVNLILQRGALELALRLGPPDLFHCHDGHAALLPAIMRLNPRFQVALRDCRALITIHNAGRGYHQEIHDFKLARQLTQLPLEVLRKGVLNDAVDPFLVGARYALINTVSEGYAGEIMSGELDELTGGLGSAFRKAELTLLGITNGISTEGFDPRDSDRTGLPFAFDPVADDLEGKRGCRQQFVLMLARLRQDSGRPERTEESGRYSQAPAFCADPELAGLEIYGQLDPASRAPLYTLVGRLTGQKGVDILAGAISTLLERRADLQFLILGQGEQTIEEQLTTMARLPGAAGKLCVLIGYNSRAAKYIYASGNFFLVPSQYEPCGLTDLFAQMMGNLPIVHAVGGLIKVRPGYSGYSYREHSVPALVGAIEESLTDFKEQPDRLSQMRRQAWAEVHEHYTWETVLRQRYLPLYAAEDP